ncbi:MAG: tagatose 1,6-diphosphate aldolase [Janthinobacterium lividum]
MKLTPGKLAGLNAVSNPDGIIAAAAMDQRGSLRKSIGAARGSEASEQDLIRFKELVTDTLTRFASAILLDPEYGLPAASKRKQAGLLLAYEKTGYDSAVEGRLPDLLDLWSVRRLKSAGADCVKILLYYSPIEDSAINERKKAWVERIGEECVGQDIPFFLELVGYDCSGKGEKTEEYARLKPSIVAGSMQEFGQDQYSVDVLKVEVPVETSFVEGTQAFKGVSAYTRKEAMQCFRDVESCSDKPYIYLSAGVTNPIFVETLELAAEAGSHFSGVLCGRATWNDGVAIYGKDGEAAFTEWLEATGVSNILKVNKTLEAATPWFERMGASSASEFV